MPLARPQNNSSNRNITKQHKDNKDKTRENLHYTKVVECAGPGPMLVE